MSDAPLRELAQQIDWEPPDAARSEAVRARVLLAATESGAQRVERRWLGVGAAFAAGALAAAALAVVLMRGSEDVRVAQPVARAQISASSAAELEHTVVATATGTDEVVRVHAGTVRVAAPAAKRGDAMRVQTRDARVEGAGEYEVTVAGDVLASVTVRSGTARIAVAGHENPVFLAAGETWHAAVVTAELPIARQPAPVPAPVGLAPVAPAPVAVAVAPAPVAKAPPRAPAARPPVEPARAAAQEPAVHDEPAAPPARRSAEIEQHFRRGWELLRANQSRDAAVELGAAADAAADDLASDPLAADARYFQAVALAQSAQPAAAERALVSFLDRAPTSLRRGRAALLLGRLIAARGDAPAARAWFESAASDPDASTATAARAALTGLAPP